MEPCPRQIDRADFNSQWVGADSGPIELSTMEKAVQNIVHSRVFTPYPASSYMVRGAKTSKTLTLSINR